MENSKNRRYVDYAYELDKDERCFLMTAVKCSGENLGEMIRYTEANSEMLFRNEKAFRELFTEVYGITPCQFLKNRKNDELERARQEKQDWQELRLAEEVADKD